MKSLSVVKFNILPLYVLLLLYGPYKFSTEQAPPLCMKKDSIAALSSGVALRLILRRIPAENNKSRYSCAAYSIHWSV